MSQPAMTVDSERPERTISPDAHPAVLTIAGSDCSGGAGIQADLKTFTALGCYGTSVTAALTAQNTTGVQKIHPVPPEFVEEQIDSVASDTPIRAMKTGMLHNSDSISAVVKALKRNYEDGKTLPHLVVDPVCVSSSGSRLLNLDAMDVMTDELFPLAALVTPNKPETDFILARKGLKPQDIKSLEDMYTAARSLTSLGPKAVLIKGGHVTAFKEDVKALLCQHPETLVHPQSPGLDDIEILRQKDDTQRLMVDILYESSNGQVTLFARPYIDSMNTHGTGCTLSAAIASHLARGATMLSAVDLASSFTHRGIAFAFPMGKGVGPLNHMHSISTNTLRRPTKDEPYPTTSYLIQSNIPLWKEYVEHTFTRKLGEGTLPEENFVRFLKDDYHYLKYYARAYSLLAAKSHSFSAIQSAMQIVSSIIQETSTHTSFCQKFGVSSHELESAHESPATVAYGCFLMEVGLRGDDCLLLIALLACLLGYGEVGLYLKRQAENPNNPIHLEGNQYRDWILDYSGEKYQNAVKLGLETIEKMVAKHPPSPARLEEWRKVWDQCTWLERNFWDSAMDDGAHDHDGRRV